MLKLCTRLVILTLTFSWPFCSHKNHIICPYCTMNRGHFVDTIAHWTVWHWPSIMVSTVSNDDVLVHKTNCFDLDLSLKLWKVTNNLDYFLLFKMDSVIVTLFYYWSTFHVNWGQYWSDTTSWRLDELIWAMFGPTPTWPNYIPEIWNFGDIMVLVRMPSPHVKDCVSRNCDTNARIKFIFDTAIDDLEWKSEKPKWPLAAIL